PVTCSSDQFADLCLACFKRPDQVLEHLPGTDLLEQVGQSLFASCEICLGRFAARIQMQHMQIAFILAALRRLFAGRSRREQSGRLLVAVQGKTVRSVTARRRASSINWLDLSATGPSWLRGRTFGVALAFLPALSPQIMRR